MTTSIAIFSNGQDVPLLLNVVASKSTCVQQKPSDLSVGSVTGIVEDVMPSPNLDDGARIQRIIEASLESARTGQRVDISSIS